jgi:CMP-N,N'-diacetyllegionaminic acid synthase
MIDTMLCCIPARAGSKRLPGKNLLPLAGKPMIAYSIELALASAVFEAVYVCTEDPTISEVARRYGASVPILMPLELCGDLVPSHVPCQHLAERLAEQGQPKEILVCLQPTSPLRSLKDLQESVDHFVKDDLDFLVSVTPIDPHYFHWAIVPQEEGNCWGMYFGDEYMRERPLLPPVYRPNGSIKIARLDKLREVGHFFGPRLGVVETPEEHSVHVGNRFDFDLCQFLLTRHAQ